MSKQRGKALNGRSGLSLIITARVIRAAAFGILSVAFALYLSDRGYSAVGIGIILTIALLAGAASSAAAGTLVRIVGRRNALLLSATAMCVSGLLLGASAVPAGIVAACLLGTLSAGGQEVGPFAAIEQHALADVTIERHLARSFAYYNLAGAFALALGSLAVTVIPTSSVPFWYAGFAAALVLIYAAMSLGPERAAPTIRPAQPKRVGPAERLAILFGVDALAGGFVVQSFLAYWFHIRFGVDQRELGLVFFGANTLAALSYLAAAWLSHRIGLLRTMVFTHLPSNLLLCLVPFMPTFWSASSVLLARFALSQMDVPTRQAFTMQMVRPEERSYAAGLTNAVRPAAAAVAPALAGLAMSGSALALPFLIAGGLKIAYDLAVFTLFRRNSQVGRGSQGAGDFKNASLKSKRE